ncbi:MAG: CehA/McbA family metallohydrolase [Myxococcota bacterium]
MRAMLTGKSRGLLAATSALALGWLSAHACGKDAGPSGPGTLQKITAIEQTIGGLESSGRVGDFLFDNGRVRLTVQAPGSATGWSVYGGSVVDLDRSIPNPTRASGDDRLQEMFFQCDLRGFFPESAEIIHDGADGQPAVLRLKGRDRGIPLVDALLSSQDLGLDVTLDYILPKDSDTLEIQATIRDLQKKQDRDLACGFVLLHGDTLNLFLPGHGFGLGGSELDYVAAAADDARASYALSRKGGPLNLLIAIDVEVLPFASERKPFLANGIYQETYYLSIGKGDVESAVSEMRKVKGDTVARQPVTVALTAPAELGKYLPNARVDFFDTEKNEGADAVTSARMLDGAPVSVALPPGHYRADVSSEGRVVDHLTVDVTASGGPSGLTAALGGSGFLHLKSFRTNKAGAVEDPTAARVIVAAGHGAPVSAPQVFSRYLKPDDTILLPAGDYTVFVSRGPEYEFDQHDITIAALETTELEAKIAHVIDTTGWITLDSHVHSTKSVDADCELEQRVLGSIGEGLDVLLSTDHDIVIDYAPTAARLMVDDEVKTETGIEISPMYGHMNAFPMPTEGESYWHVPWYEYDSNNIYKRMINPDEITVLARKKGAQVVQVNHPRGGKGIFDYILFDPATGGSNLPWPNADAFEILNSKGGGPFEQMVQDFSGMLQANKRMTATGVSDAHGRGSQIGYARSAVKSSIDDPKNINLMEVWGNLRAGHVIAMSGPFIRFKAQSGTEQGDIGDTIASGGRPVRFDVEVDAPSWMNVNRLRVIADGATLVDRPIRAEDALPTDATVRLRTTVTATPAKDAFYFVIAEGAANNPPVLDARARSVTNPIFVDADGSGYQFHR